MQRWLLSLCTLLLCSAATLLNAKAQSQASQPEPPVYEIYAISYGVIPDFPVSSLVAGAGADEATCLAATLDRAGA